MEGEEAKNIQTSKDPREQVSLSRSRILALLGQMCLAWACLQVTELWEIWREGPGFASPKQWQDIGAHTRPTYIVLQYWGNAKGQWHWH